MNEIPFRQVHIDFHTSPFIPDIGAGFDPEEFSSTLKNAHVEIVTLFAKCHHGMCYYPTKIGTVHPNLKFDLLGSMIDACHRAGIKTPVYMPTGWEEDSAEKHPEWQQIPKDGVLGGRKPFEARWRSMCHNNSGYIDMILAETAEILDNYPVDGMYYDIVTQFGCLCGTCMKSMANLGFDPRNELDVAKHDFITVTKFMERISAFIKTRRPDIEIGFNTSYSPSIGYEKAYSPKLKSRYNSSLAIESLPTGGWGYNHFPLNVNWHNTFGYEVFGGTAKFHKSWGDFGSLKSQEAMDYEFARMIANGAKCNVGDQLHPSGRMDAAVYNRIGRAFEKVRQREPWCRNTGKLAEIGIITSNKDFECDYISDEGAMRMMLELKLPFDFLDCEADLNKYRLVILPDEVLLNDDIAEKIRDYLKKGGKLLMSGCSGLTTGKAAFALDEFGVRYKGEAPFTPDYIRLGAEIGKGIEQLDYCFYHKGIDVEASAGSETLGIIVKPYFNRTYDRFCSHMHFPPEKPSGSPAIVRRGNVIHISRMIFKEYITGGARVYRQIIDNCIRLLLPDPLFESDLPLSAEITLRTQKDRVILHIVNYIPQRKCKENDIVEEVIPLYDRTVRVKLEKRPERVYLAPECKDLPYSYENGCAVAVIPEIQGHQMLVFEG